MQRPWFMTPWFALALMTLLVGAGHLHAESPLEAMVQQALQNNPGLKAQRAKIAAAQRVKRRQTGISIADTTWDKITAVAAQYQVSLDDLVPPAPASH